MSATRDKDQKVAFVYNNLYHLYRKGKDAAKNADLSQAQAAPAEEPISGAAPSPSRNILKTDDLNHSTFGHVRVREYSPAELIGKRINKPEVIQHTSSVASAVAPAPAAKQVLDPSQTVVESLKDNLKTLNDLHSRLRFMLQELEELVKE